MVLTALLVAGVFFLIQYLSDVLVPFAVAAALAYFLNPLVTEIERRTKRRGFAVFYTLGGIFIVGSALIVLMVPLVMSQVTRFEKDLSRLRVDLSAALLPTPVHHPVLPVTVPPMAAHLTAAASSAGSIAATQPTGIATTQAATSQPVEEYTFGFQALWEGWADYLAEANTVPRAVRLEHLLARVRGTLVGTLLENAMEFVKTTEFNALMFDLVKRVAVGGFTVINVAVEMLLGTTVVLVILLYLVFMLLDFPKYLETWKSFIPGEYRGDIVGFFREFEAVLRRYFRGQFIVASISGALYALGFSIMGLPMAVPFGLFIGALTMVPYLPMLALVPGVLLAILRSLGGDSSLVGSFIWLGVVYVAVQIIQEGIIVPRVMGQATGLSPVAIILGLLICSKLLGFLGLVLAIPLTCLAVAYYRRFILRHSLSETALSDPAPPGPAD